MLSFNWHDLLLQWNFFDIIYEMTPCLAAYDLQGSIGLDRRGCAANKSTRSQPVEWKAVILIRQGDAAALLFEQLDVAAHSARLGRSRHAGRKCTIERLILSVLMRLYNTNGSPRC